jgi:hypothetical protein
MQVRRIMTMLRMEPLTNRFACQQLHLAYAAEFYMCHLHQQDPATSAYDAQKLLPSHVSHYQLA